MTTVLKINVNRTVIPSMLNVKSFSGSRGTRFWIRFMDKLNLQNHPSMSRHIFDLKTAAFPGLCFEVWVRSLRESRHDLSICCRNDRAVTHR